MPKFRKKPVVIDAVQWKNEPDGDSLKEILALSGNNGRVTFAADGTADLIIETLEGDMRANVNDWIIRGTKGEIYPCKPDIFETIYEAEWKPLPIDPWQEKLLEQKLQDEQAMIAACGVPRSYLGNPMTLKANDPRFDNPEPTILEQLQAQTRLKTAGIPPGKTKAAVFAVEWAGGVPYRFRFGYAHRVGDHFELGADAITKFSKASTSATIHVGWSS